MFQKKWFKILTSVIAVLLIAVLAFGSLDTSAWFSDSASTKKNVFTAGTLDLDVSNSFGGGYGDGVTATWDSPDDWAPSESTSAKIYFTNKGNVNILEMAMDFKIVSQNGQGDGSQLDDVVTVTKWTEYFNGTGYDFLGFVTSSCGDGLAPLSLSELEGCTPWHGTSAPGPVTQDNKSGDAILVEGGNKKDYALELEFTFDENAGNEYQGDTMRMDIEFIGTQDFHYFNNLTGKPHPGW